MQQQPQQPGYFGGPGSDAFVFPNNNCTGSVPQETFPSQQQPQLYVGYSAPEAQVSPYYDAHSGFTTGSLAHPSTTGNEEEEQAPYPSSSPPFPTYGGLPNGNGSTMEVLDEPTSASFYAFSSPTVPGSPGGAWGDRHDVSNDHGALNIPASLSLHPVAAATLRERLRAAQRRSPNGQLDPLTAALLCRQQQEDDGQPRSPLSPHTLQRCLAALAAGEPFTLTPEALLAPSPLALTWHKGDDRESLGSDRHTSSRVEVLSDTDGEDAAPLSRGRWGSRRTIPKRAREDTDNEDEPQYMETAFPRTEHVPIERGAGGVADGAVPSSWRLPRSQAEAPSENHTGSLHKGDGVTDTNNSGLVTPWKGPVDAGTRKRGRDEPVFEYDTHGRRLH